MLQCYAIKDNKVGAFAGQPFWSRNHIEMVRSLSQVVKDPQSNLSKFVEDFSVYLIGGFEEASGEFQLTKDGTPQFVLNLVELKEIGK